MKIVIFEQPIFIEVMDIQAEKLHLIEWLVRLNDVKVIQEIKALKKETSKDLFKRYTDQDMINRAEASMEDIAMGRTTKLADFKTEIDHWKQSKSMK